MREAQKTICVEGYFKTKLSFCLKRKRNEGEEKRMQSENLLQMVLLKASTQGDNLIAAVVSCYLPTSPHQLHSIFLLHLNKKISMAIYGSCVGQSKNRQNVLKPDSTTFILALALLNQVKLGLQLRSTLNEGKNREKTRDTFHVWGIVPDAGFPPFSAVSSVQRRKVLH